MADEATNTLTDAELAELAELEALESQDNPAGTSAESDQVQSVENHHDDNASSNNAVSDKSEGVNETFVEDDEDGEDASDEELADDNSDVDDAVDVLADEYEEDSEFFDNTVSWSEIGEIIVLVANLAKSKKNDPRYVTALANLFYNVTDKNIKPFVLAEKIYGERDERAEMTEFILDELASRHSSVSGGFDPASMRKKFFELADWAYNIPDDERKLVGRSIGAIAEIFPKRVKKTDDEGNTVRDEEGNKVYVDDIFVPKRTTKQTDGGEIISMLEELADHTDIDAVKSFMEWYRGLISEE